MLPETPPAPANDLNIPILPPTIGDPSPDPNTPPAPAPDPTAERLAALEAQLEAQRQQNAQLMQLMVQRPAAPPAAPPPPALEPFSLEGLPDAVQAPTDFTRQLAQRIQQREQNLTQHVTQAITQQVARGATLDSLYNQMRSQHPELAKRTALLQGAAGVVFSDMRAQGIDPIDLAQRNPDSVIGAIVNRMSAELGTPATPPATPPPNGAPMTPYSPPTTIGSAARTAGIASGSPTPVAPKAPPPPPGFLAQLNAARARDGLI